MNGMHIKLAGALGAAAVLLGGALIATPANAQTVGVFVGGGGCLQAQKNAARNVGIGLGAAAAYELTQGKGTNALILGAGAALAGAQYETDRKAENNLPAYGYRTGYGFHEGFRPFRRPVVEEFVPAPAPRFAERIVAAPRRFDYGYDHRDHAWR